MIDDAWDDDDADGLVPRGGLSGRRERRRPPLPPVPPEPRRWPTVAVVMVLLALAGVAAVTIHPRQAGPGPGPAVSVEGGMPVVVPVAARSSAWYCPGPMPVGAGARASSILLANTGPTAVSGRIQISAASGASATTSVHVPARGSSAVPVKVPGPASYASASVTLGGGGVGAEELVTAPGGPGAAACDVTTASTWYFPSGSTAPGADVRLGLYDPTASPAIVDLSFSTSAAVTTSVAGGTDGGVTPASAGSSSPTTSVPGGTTATSGGGQVSPPVFQGLTVNPGQLLVVDVGHEVQLRPEVATTVTVTSGRVVAGEWASATIDNHYRAALVSGVEQPRDHWWFPLAAVPQAAVTGYWVYNPLAAPARVQLVVSLAGGTSSTTLAVDVPATSMLVISPPAVAPSGSGKVKGKRSGKAPPPGWAEIESLGGSGVVAARGVFSNGARTRRAGSGSRSSSTIVAWPETNLGAAAPATSWVLDGRPIVTARTGRAGSTGAGSQAVDSIAVAFPPAGGGGLPVEVQVTVLAPAGAAGEPGGTAPTSGSPARQVTWKASVAPGGVTIVPVPAAYAAGALLVVVGGGGVVVERDYASVGSTGGFTSIGIPLA